MSQSSEPSVYKGPWVNWSHGRVLGCTITLSEGDGALLTAFLAVFVAAAGTACWKILSYTLHQCRAKHQPQDAFHHQLQVVFRNTGTAGGAVWQFLQLAWYWRKQSVGPFARILPVTLLALLNLVFFSLAAIFSSQVTKSAGDQVLIRSPRCGWLNSTLEPSSIQGSDTFGNLIINDTLTASTYSKACYGDSANPLQCNQYIRKSLPWETNQNASCPFLSSMCYYGATGAYSMDSGLLDSHSDIGINARESGRVQYRKVTTCSPIHFSSYVRDFNDTDPDHLAYGDRLFDIMLGGAPGITDYTLRYNMHTKVDNIGYALYSYVAFADSPYNAWVPIPALNRSDGDITLILLAANSIVYEKPVTDPFFAASTLKPVILDDGTNLTYYAPYSLVSGIACMDQHQFCNPTNRKCTDLTSSTALGINNDQFRQLGFKRAQYATAQHINVFTGPLTTYSSVGIRGPNALRASETIHNDFFQIGLPNTQWMTEVSSWFAISMAKLQQKTLQYATGPPSIPEGYNFIGPRSWEEKRICDNQIIRSTSGTTSFSVLGVIIILVVGSILIVTSLLQDMVVPLIRGMRGKKNQYKTLQYVVDGTWQLQRLAYEEAGQGHWSGGADAVPVTRKDDKIGLPHNVNEKHPRLSQASTVVESNTSVAEADVLTMDPKGYGS